MSDITMALFDLSRVAVRDVRVDVRGRHWYTWSPTRLLRPVRGAGVLLVGVSVPHHAAKRPALFLIS